MTTNKTIREFRVGWTADHEQYYPGHSIMSSEYTHSGQGCGETLREAFEDALEDLAQQGIELQSLPAEFPEDDIDRQMLADLTAQVKDPAMLDWDIVQAKCDVQGEHSCDNCEHAHACHQGHSENLMPLGSGVRVWDTCDQLTDGGETCDCSEFGLENVDCAVCAGEWHFYVNVDVKVEGE